MQGAGLLLGADRQIVVALGDLRAGGGDRIRALTYIHHDRCEVGLHVGQTTHECRYFIGSVKGNVLAQVAPGHSLGNSHSPSQGVANAARQYPGEPG